MSEEAVDDVVVDAVVVVTSAKLPEPSRYVVAVLVAGGSCWSWMVVVPVSSSLAPPSLLPSSLINPSVVSLGVLRLC